MEETYCVFCGVCFGIDFNLYHGRVNDIDTNWAKYFVACSYKMHLFGLNSLSIRSVRRRKYPPGYDGDPLPSWYLSGVGVGIREEGYAPPPGYGSGDDGNEDLSDMLFGDFVVAYSNR